MQRIQVEQDTRAARAASLARQLDGLYSGEAVPSDWVGGRAEALRRLNAFDAHEYARGRNFTVGGVVSQLSAYIRHGAVSLAEVRHFVVRKFPRHAIEILQPSWPGGRFGAVCMPPQAGRFGATWSRQSMCLRRCVASGTQNYPTRLPRHRPAWNA